ncbi:MAG TPA: hypothetical protein VNY10_20990 [Roseiarcus sp.]|nr:hypothetical protein [Roseiarcus sp.]
MTPRVMGSGRETIAEHREAAPRLLARGLVLDDVPVLGQLAVLEPQISTTIQFAGRPKPLNRPWRST